MFCGSFYVVTEIEVLDKILVLGNVLLSLYVKIVFIITICAYMICPDMYSLFPPNCEFVTLGFGFFVFFDLLVVKIKFKDVE